MARDYTNEYYVDLAAEAEIKAPPGLTGREYLLIQNQSSDSIYVNIGTHAASGRGVEVAAGQFYEREQHPPQGTIYVSGAAVAGTAQRIVVTESYRG